jgi:predicted deacylase
MNNELVIGHETIRLGETKYFSLKVSESALGTSISMPIKVIRSKKPGPVVLVLAGIHGDEMNGVGIVRDLMLNPPKLKKGTLVCMPVVNVFAFEANSRYLPDRRDLNRCFPGRKDGTLGARLAHFISNEIVRKCDYVIDLHTAAFTRTNSPQIRVDYRNKKAAELAKAFNPVLILDTKGESTTLRAWATKNGIPTITYEAGEPNRFEPDAIKFGLRGIKNVLKTFDMLTGEAIKPEFQIVVKKTTWLRTNKAGILELKVKSGDLVPKGGIIATCISFSSSDETSIKAKCNGIVVGLVVRPTIKPGEPVCNFAELSTSQFMGIYKRYAPSSKNEK